MANNLFLALHFDEDPIQSSQNSPCNLTEDRATIGDDLSCMNKRLSRYAKQEYVDEHEHNFACTMHLPNFQPYGIYLHPNNQKCRISLKKYSHCVKIKARTGSEGNLSQALFFKIHFVPSNGASIV